MTVAFPLDASDSRNDPPPPADRPPSVDKQVLVKREPVVYCDNPVLQIVEDLLVDCSYLRDSRALTQCRDEVGQYRVELVLGLGLCRPDAKTSGFWRRLTFTIWFKFYSPFCVCVCVCNLRECFRLW